MEQEKTIFSKIIDREIPAHILYEDELCIVFLDAFPAVEGQTLVIPKQQVSYVFDLKEKLYQHIFSVAQKVAKALDHAFGTERTCLVVEGFEVPHVHIKLYPLTTRTPLGYVLENTAPLSPEVGAALAQKISASL